MIEAIAIYGIYALALVIAWLIVALTLLAQNRAKYKAAFRDVASQLYNVTAERNKLSIQNEGLKRELARSCVENEKLNEHVHGRSPTLKPEHRE